MRRDCADPAAADGEPWLDMATSLPTDSRAADGPVVSAAVSERLYRREVKRPFTDCAASCRDPLRRESARPPGERGLEVDSLARDAPGDGGNEFRRSHPDHLTSNPLSAGLGQGLPRK